MYAYLIGNLLMLAGLIAGAGVLMWRLLPAWWWWAALFPPVVFALAWVQHRLGVRLVAAVVDRLGPDRRR